MDERQARRLANDIYRRLLPEDIAKLRTYMLQGRDEEGLSEAYCDLGNAGFCVPCTPPFSEADVRLMLAVLGSARVCHRTMEVDWKCMLKGAFGSRVETIRLYYEEASGLTDAFLFAPIHFGHH